MPFVKIDCGILDSTIWCEDSGTCKVWITMLAMADSAGLVGSTAPGIARRSNMTLAQTRAAIEILESPDPDSRTSSDEGKRISRVEGGYRITNYDLYRNKDHSAAERMRFKRARMRTGQEEGLVAQDYKCGCCSKPFNKPYHQHVVQDRCHKTQAARGLVCQSCNEVVVQLMNNDKIALDSEKLFLANQYVEKWSDVTTRNVTQAYAEAYAYKKIFNKRKSSLKIFNKRRSSCTATSQKSEKCAVPEHNGSGIVMSCAKIGSLWEVPNDKILEWEESFPDVDVRLTLLGIRQWLRDNQDKRKTPQGMTRFINGWMMREQDKPNGGHNAKAPIR